jgi:branched-chain amino acid transport system ATP-binding protein
MCVADSNHFGEKPFDTILFYNKNRKTEKQRKEKALAILKDLFGNKSLFVKEPEMLAGNLSYGQQRLLGLARLLMGNYSLILLDEPTAGVNAKLNNKIATIVKLLKEQGKTIFLIEHNMAFVRKTADHVAFLNEHNIYTQGSPAKVLNNNAVQQHYLGIL